MNLKEFNALEVGQEVVFRGKTFKVTEVDYFFDFSTEPATRKVFEVCTTGGYTIRRDDNMAEIKALPIPKVELAQPIEMSDPRYHLSDEQNRILTICTNVELIDVLRNGDCVILRRFPHNQTEIYVMEQDGAMKDVSNYFMDMYMKG